MAYDCDKENGIDDTAWSSAAEAPAGVSADPEVSAPVNGAETASDGTAPGSCARDYPDSCVEDLKTEQGDSRVGGTGVCKKTTIGGQALIEGLMMLGPEKQAIAVREPGGAIVLDVKDRPPFANKFNVPFLRGVVRLVTQLKTGVRALSYSADIAMKDNAEDSGKEKKESCFDRFASRHPNLIMGFSLVLSISLSVALFILLPSVLTDLFRKVTGLGAGEQGGALVFVLSLIEGFLRISIFILYLWLTSFSKDMKRVWKYHGSEHKTIAAYEAGLPLTVENIRGMSRFHPRCGTSFLFLVMFISILAFAVVGRYTLWVNILIRIAMLPLVAGISYEIIRFAGRYDHAITRAVSKPGLALQRLTTAEPDDEMLEVAIAAMEAVIPENPDRDRW
ncbi:MAG TPA: DUF1385 domain-containing protein [Bacillota bacterium]|nr:DUF1385 domain-containing protein [Bacillota bacterium]